MSEADKDQYRERAKLDKRQYEESTDSDGDSNSNVEDVYDRDVFLNLERNGFFEKIINENFSVNKFYQKDWCTKKETAREFLSILGNYIDADLNIVNQEQHYFDGGYYKFVQLCEDISKFRGKTELIMNLFAKHDWVKMMQNKINVVRGVAADEPQILNNRTAMSTTTTGRNPMAPVAVPDDTLIESE